MLGYTSLLHHMPQWAWVPHWGLTGHLGSRCIHATCRVTNGCCPRGADQDGHLVATTKGQQGIPLVRNDLLTPSGKCRMNLETRLIMVNGEAHTARDYIQAQKVRGRMMGHLAQAFWECDVLVTPTTAITAPKIR